MAAGSLRLACVVSIGLLATVFPGEGWSRRSRRPGSGSSGAGQRPLSTDGAILSARGRLGQAVDVVVQRHRVGVGKPEMNGVFWRGRRLVAVSATGYRLRRRALDARSARMIRGAFVAEPAIDLRRRPWPQDGQHSDPGPARGRRGPRGDAGQGRSGW
jgi:hypothetical protein